MYSAINSGEMQLRRCSKRVFRFYFRGFVFDKKRPCPFCQSGGKSLRIVKKGFDPQILLANCQNFGCVTGATALDVIRLWHNLDLKYARRVLSTFDEGKSDQQISKTIKECINEQEREKRQTFQS